jgi:peptidoglycan/LPS O-acetylase OafA/YrhL
MQPPKATSPERYPCLDGIRGLAILFVLASHISNFRGMLFTGSGEFGVWLFFVLSSFLLSLYFFQQPARIVRPIEWTNYAFRRFLRVYPLYIVAVILGCFYWQWGVGGAIDTILLRTPTYWAVFVEFRFYFLLPLIVVGFEYSGRLNKLLPLLLMIVTIAVHYLIFPDGSTVLGYEPWSSVNILFWEYLVVFVMGSFAAWGYVHTPRLRSLLAASRAADAAALLLVIASICAVPGVTNQLALAITQVFPSIEVTKLAPEYYHFQWVPWSALFSVTVYLVMATNGFSKSLFESRVMRFFGMVSFSTYLFMDFLIPSLTFFTDPIFFLFVAVGVVSAVSFSTFALIERPLSRLSLLSNKQFRDHVKSNSRENEKLVAPAVAETAT